MERLYAPWRKNYVVKNAKKNEEITESECVFCHAYKAQQDDKYFIIRRFEHTFVMLNLYPYASGHLLILPFEHTAHLHELAPEVQIELMRLVTESTRIVTQVLNTHGINIGVNLGKAAGAGIPEHVHIHLLPRWKGDTNFLPLIADVKAISVDLNSVYQQMKDSFANLLFAVAEYPRGL